MDLNKNMDLRFDGRAYDPKYDKERLTNQIRKIYYFMSDGSWRTLGEISAATGAPEASASAGLRDFRKERFGSQTVNKRRRGDPCCGLWEYQLVIKVGK